MGIDRTFHNMSIRITSLLAVATFLGPLVPAQAQLRGVNIAGAEFGEHTIPGEPGIHYTFNSEETFAYFAEKDLPLFRVPIRWERIQPAPFGDLDAAYLAMLEQNILWARKHGARIIVDVHNYGRYKLREGGSTNEYTLDNRYSGAVKTSSEALVDLWLRLSERFRNQPGVYGYGLMNEPHDMGSADWKAISQTLVSAIRATGDMKALFVAGDSWSSAERWEQTHGLLAWIDDPADNFYYEAHLYFDQDASGRYGNSFQQELAWNPDLRQIGRRRLQPFADWCRGNHVRCFVGEYGVPANDPGWLETLGNLLTAMDEAGMGGTYWAAGDWWGDYSLSVHPVNGVQKPQLATLQTHAGPRFATSVSAASSLQGPLAPASLASVYGTGFSDGVQTPASQPLPSQLGPVRVEIAPAGGAVQPVQLVFVSPGQINYLLPEDLPEGPAELRIYRDGKLIAIEPIEIAAVSPGLFSANGRGQGAPAGQILHIAADGQREYETLATYDAGSGTFSPRPIRFRAEGERIFLILYGTGFRNAADASILLNGQPGPPLAYFGSQPDFPGLDQANFELPASFAGAGAVRLMLSLPGASSNGLEIIVQ